MSNQRLLNDVHEIIFKGMDLNIKNILGSLELKFLLEIDEIRLRVNKPLMVCRSNEDFLINKNGKIVKSVDQAFIVRECEIYNSLQLLSQYSLYSIEEELSKGFITLKGGHRVGITGKAIIEKGNIKTIKYVNGLNYRIMREVKGCSQKISKIIRKDSKDLFHTLIAGPPKTGKTTILRDLVRRFSTGDEQYPGLKIGVVDERSEIAGCHRGIPQNDVGIRTDVLDCCPKAQGIINLIRSMSPEVIVTDEIGSKEDLVSIHEALSAGIKIITTVHGANIEELLNRPYISQMIRDRLFEKIIFLDNSKGVGTISSVVDVKDIIRIGIENVS
ncbi:stage III sporulation protein AA [Alkalibaculum sporogenes]|nr:stage III sporulation protein AA [Alkalibaculum sporogenes]